MNKERTAPIDFTRLKIDIDTTMDPENPRPQVQRYECPAFMGVLVEAMDGKSLGYNVIHVSPNGGTTLDMAVELIDAMYKIGIFQAALNEWAKENGTTIVRADEIEQVPLSQMN